VYELGLRRLIDDFGLNPVEYPTTRAVDADPADRARDLEAAFADPSITAVLATVGGDDEIRVVRHLDPAIFRGNPKPYFGYSDNTNLLNFLWRNGVVSYHGGSVMVHLGRPGELHPLTRASLRAALFTSGEYELSAPTSFSDEELGWDSSDRSATPATRPAGEWIWRRADRVVTGRTWGGNLEGHRCVVGSADVLNLGAWARVQMARASSLNAVATRRAGGASMSSS
jgi:muramoyltetrapeptide carboxypeptidase LdcA involved in peptidoglycan recycling